VRRDDPARPGASRCAQHPHAATTRTQPQLKRAGDLPGWLGDPAFHRSHQSSLLRKNPAHYTFDVPDDLPYVWP